MTNEEIIKNRMAKKPKGKLHFKNGDVSFIALVRELRRTVNPQQRILKILGIGDRYITNNKYNNYQCRSGANRSLEDICRLYNYYFGDYDIFEIMRSLHKLVRDKNLATDVCSVIKKQVFW